MQLFTLLENVDSLRRKPAEMHEVIKSFPILATPLSSCRVNLLFSPQATPQSALHHQHCWSTAKARDKQAGRQRDIRGCPCSASSPCLSTPILFPLTIPNPDHSGTRSVLSRLRDFAHAVLEAWNAFPPLVLHLRDSYSLCKPAPKSPPVWRLLPYPPPSCEPAPPRSPLAGSSKCSSIWTAMTVCKSGCPQLLVLRWGFISALSRGKEKPGSLIFFSMFLVYLKMKR